MSCASHTGGTSISTQAQIPHSRSTFFLSFPLLDAILAGDRESYQYLIETIRRFPSQGVFSQVIAEAGYQQDMQSARISKAMVEHDGTYGVGLSVYTLV